MKNSKASIVMLMTFFISASWSQQALAAAPVDTRKPEPAAQPPVQRIAVPQAPVAVQAPKLSTIPVLPVSLPCKPNEIGGTLWKLKQVYEDPEGVELGAFNQNPMQYTWYRLNGVYGKYNGAHNPVPPPFVQEQITKHSTNLLQFLVQTSGIIYYYQDKVATDVQSCFIVQKDKDQFTRGEMLLMPPKGRIEGRLIKQYVKVWSAAKPNQNPGAPGNNIQLRSPGGPGSQPGN